jgi:CRISPR/Cas system-associated exonuclease Cas4 (RecB family)
MNYLTKSLYVNGLQCPKLLWIKCNEKERIPKPDESSQHLFDQGKQVGDLAKTLFKGGIEIKAEYWELAESDKKSREALKLRKPLFEAGFMVGELYSRADVLLPVGKNEWDLVEVKSGSSIKEENIHDVSFQRYVYEKAGLKIRKCFLMHMNPDYVRKGKINVKKLFLKEDITDKVNETIIGIEDRIAEMLKIMNSKTCPVVKIGPQCNKFHGCALKDYCWGKVPLTSVLNLAGSSATAFELYDSGVKNLGDIPENFELNFKQLIQHKCAKSGQPCVHKEKIKQFLGSLKYPLYFMDFETYATAIPLYNGLKPFQPIPFQFSVHIIGSDQQSCSGSESNVKHFSFIAQGSGDPRKQFIKELKKVLGDKGSILVYYQSFEKGRLEELGNLFPKYKPWIESIFERIVDLITPFSSFAYYNSKQEGSASLKEVLPALTGKSYEGMNIAEGQMASLSYLYITHGTIDGKKATADEVKKIREDLEEYCGLDTEGMIWILDALRALVK